MPAPGLVPGAQAALLVATHPHLHPGLPPVQLNPYTEQIKASISPRAYVEEAKLPKWINAKGWPIAQLSKPHTSTPLTPPATLATAAAQPRSPRPCPGSATEGSLAGQGSLAERPGAPSPAAWGSLARGLWLAVQDV